MGRELLVVAGETSGDLHAAGVAAVLRARCPELVLSGVGGSRMAEAGVQLLERAERLAVLGASEALRHIPRHYALLRRLERRLRGGQVRLVMLVDYPGFNLKVAAAARRADVPVLYYITPQVWAWGVGRVARLARDVSRAAVILPFEEALLRARGVPATFVGHPLLDHAARTPERAEARRRLGVGPGEKLLAVFPGSRSLEIQRHLDAFIATALELRRRDGGLRVIVSGAPGVRVDEARCPFPVVSAQSLTVLRAADAALCKSGTTTLEAAVAGCPLVVAYRTSGWTYALARRFLTVRHIGLVNIVAGRVVAPEFVQDALVPERIADALEPLLDRSDARRHEMITALDDVRARLGTAGAAERVADLAVELLR